MANELTTCSALSTLSKKLCCLAWMFLLMNHWLRVQCSQGCSFSDDDWCGYSNEYNGTEGPRWHRQKAPAQQNPNRYQQSSGIRMSVYGTHPMRWPPKGDYYLFTGPTQDNRLAEKNAELKSPLILVNGTSTCLYFSYHNQVPIKLSPTLIIFKRDANISGEEREKEDEILAEFYSLNSDKWFEEAVRLPEGEYHVIFSGKSYNNRTLTGGQIAITNIAIVEGDCGKTVPEWLKTPGDCGFENDLEFCGYQYTNDSNVGMMKILAESLSAAEQSQSSQRQPPGDHFLLMTSKFYEIANQGNRAKLLSPEVSIAREGCLLMWYYNSIQSKHDSNNVLNILKLDHSEQTVLFRLPIPKTHRDRWYQFNGALPRGEYRLIVEVIYTGDFVENDYVGFDNIEIFNKSCSDVKSIGNVCDAGSPRDEAICRNGGSCVSTGKKHFRCVCNENYYGTRCEHEYRCSANLDFCRNGGTCLPDGKLDSSCACSPGFEGKRCEQIKSCGSPENVLKNARAISVTNETFGSTARFECIDGWLTIGDLTATCNAQGSWVAGRGKCVWIFCALPPNFSHATLVHVTNTTFMGKAKYKCAEGMTTRKQRDFLVCKIHPHHYDYGNLQGSVSFQGYWLNMESSEDISCYAIPHCEYPPTFSNAYVNITSLLMDGVATYRCSDGYEMDKNRSSLAMSCSERGRWIFYEQISGQLIDVTNLIQNYQYTGNFDYYLMRVFMCLKTPDCGIPPKIPNSMVDYSDTMINSTATYTCKEGYRLIGSEVAECWKVSDNRFQQWVDWLFVPSCEFVCPVKDGRRGNFTVAIFEVSHCSLSGLGVVSTKLECDPPVTYSIRRKSNRTDHGRSLEKIVFYGNDFCVSERARIIKIFEGTVVQETFKCRSACIQSVTEIRDVLLRDELTVRHSKKQGTGGASIAGIAYEATRRQELIRYQVVAFN